MGEVPRLVADIQLRAPQGHHHQRDQRVDRQGGEAGAPRRLDEIEQREQFRPDDEQDERVRNDQADRYQRDLAVKVIDDVLAPRLGDVAEARREAELQAHHRQAGIAERDRELRPEIARRRQRPRQEREQRGEDEEQINDDPNGPTHGIGKHRLNLRGCLCRIDLAISHPGPYGSPSNSRHALICLLPFSVPWQGAVAAEAYTNALPKLRRGYARRHSAPATHSTPPVPPAKASGVWGEVLTSSRSSLLRFPQDSCLTSAAQIWLRSVSRLTRQRRLQRCLESCGDRLLSLGPLPSKTSECGRRAGQKLAFRSSLLHQRLLYYAS